MKRKSLSFLRKKALELGVRDCKVIMASSIKTAGWVRFKCQYGCEGFGECLTCPPYSPTLENTRDALGSYKKAMLIHGDNKTKNFSEILFQLEREVFLSGFYKVFAMGAGPCRLCKSCNKKKCRFPRKARPSMEACGIDVYETVRNNGFHLEVLKSYNCKMNFFGLLLIE